MENIEIVFSFDTTGSMAPCLGEVRKRVEEAFTPLFKEMPNLKVGVIAHGDYCDKHIYVTSVKDLTNDLYSLCQFVRNTRATGGGDADECYELVLHEAQKLNWTVNSRKILVMIGDANPHSPSYPMNTLKLNWQTEAQKLRDMGVTIYSVQALNRAGSNAFYSALAAITGGYHLRLNQFNEAVEMIMAITMQQAGPEAFDAWEKKVIASNRMSRSMDETFNTLNKRASSATTKKFESYASEGLVPVAPGRFQVLHVDDDIDIRGFVQENDLIFQLGRGFYQFTKTEDIQEKKEVVLQDKFTGDMFTGNEARNIIGVPFGTRGRLRPTHLDKYKIFVQSTSVNRKLKGGTDFLYEVAADR